jgi:hypothetical protein
MVRLTAAQKSELAEKAAKTKSARRWAYSVMTAMLSASIAANVADSWDLGPLAWIMSGFAPLGLFLTSELLFRLGVVKHRWIYISMLACSALVAGWMSYWHIWSLTVSTLGNGHGIAYLMALSVDLPMLMAGGVLASTRKSEKPKRVAKRAKAPVRVRSTANVTKPVLAT